MTLNLVALIGLEDDFFVPFRYLRCLLTTISFEFFVPCEYRAA
jgi:hypothetical protein